MKTPFTFNELKDMIRWTKDIGMFSFDRPIYDTENHQGSCNDWKTSYCSTTCYNNKLYKMYPNMAKRDDRIESLWQRINVYTITSLVGYFYKKRNQTKRKRLMTRGEAFKTATDVYRVRTLLLSDPDSVWWIPTRAWRDPRMKALIEKEIMTLPNHAVNASLDPSNSKEEWQMLDRDGWNTMFYGDDTIADDNPNLPKNKRMFKCPKTHKGLKGHCASCKAGCFSFTAMPDKRQVHTHLSQH